MLMRLSVNRLLPSISAGVLTRAKTRRSLTLPLTSMRPSAAGLGNKSVRDDLSAERGLQEREVSLNLLAVTVLFFLGQLLIRRSHLTLPLFDQIPRNRERSIWLLLALAMQILLPMSPAFMFNAGKFLNQSV